MSFYRSILPQALRYGLVGLSSNIILYLLYLLITTLGVGHKSAMTSLFALGVVQTFIFNKRWTFAHQGFLKPSFVKYVAAYSFAYLLNLAALLVFVDHFRFPHQLIQGVMTLTLALMLFLLQKLWVFRSPATVATQV
jgi:putative flippase GtrA